MFTTTTTTTTKCLYWPLLFLEHKTWMGLSFHLSPDMVGFVVYILGLWTGKSEGFKSHHKWGFFLLISFLTLLSQGSVGSLKEVYLSVIEKALTKKWMPSWATRIGTSSISTFGVTNLLLKVFFPTTCVLSLFYTKLHNEEYIFSMENQ